jgi:hypothetical protein
LEITRPANLLSLHQASVRGVCAVLLFFEFFVFVFAFVSRQCVRIADGSVQDIKAALKHLAKHCSSPEPMPSDPAEVQEN